MTDQPVSEGVVHGVIEDLELPPEPPPHGPRVWIRENLLSGDTPIAIGLNGLLTVVFGLIALNVLQFLTTYLFNPDRRWSAVTFNMKLMMVQAFPQADLGRIWLSIGIFLVLVAWSLIAWNVQGRITLHKFASGVRSAGVLITLTAILHGTFEGDRILDIGILKIDSPGSWSGSRTVIFLIGLILGVGAHLYLTRSGPAAKERSIPFLSVLAGGMVLTTIVIWTIQLPVPEGRFDEVTEGIATSTKVPWTILFLVTIAFYFIGKRLVTVMDRERFKRILVFLWVFSYPVIIMVIQRKPILEWSNILGFGDVPFLESDFGLLLLFGVLGGAVIWVLAFVKDLNSIRVVGIAVGAVVTLVPWFMSEAPLWVSVIAGVFGLGLVAGSLLISDGPEIARIVGSVLAIAALLVWFLPMAFLLRTLIIAFAFVALAAPSFGGTEQARLRMTLTWVFTALLVVATFTLGEAETALEFQSTTFLGGFNLSILLAITGVALSFPLGVVLALARTSTMPIFRLIATGYIELVRSVPLITWLFFGSVMLALFLPGGVEFDEILRIVAAISIFNAAYVAENIRGGLQAIGSGQYEAARAMGLSTVQSTSLIVLPQAIRAVLPALVGSIIVSFKDTSLVAIIGLADVLLIARNFVPTQSDPSFRGTQPQMLFFIALFYWVFTFTFSRLSLRYEKSLGLGER